MQIMKGKGTGNVQETWESMRNLSLSMYTISQQTTELQAVYK